ncbi:hypothetical protein [Brevundimonas sp.]|jgi:choline dehydrogenase-like flavoprotein|uniref:hypothetical protein n=1 Tax=Brevundimonas sp. TaxID=1871086 RepID=UPI003784AD34
MSKIKLLNPISELIAKLGIGYIDDKVFAALEGKQLPQKLADRGFDRVRQTIEAITDDNAANADQVAAVWLAYLNEDVIPAVGEAIAPTLEAIESPETRALVISLAGMVVSAALLLTDNQDNNNAQLKAYFETHIKSDDFRSVIVGQVRALAEKYSKDKALVGLIISVFGAFFDLIQGVELDQDQARLLAGGTE